jgi:hypothetical protein
VEPEDFVNRRSEWHWNLRLRFENGEIDIDPDDNVLAQAAGRDQVEDDLKRSDRGGD